MRFIATADWQWGMTAHFLPEEARLRFRQDRLDAVRRIGELADERGAAFVLVCGDVFESNQLDRRLLARAFEALRRVRVPVFLLPGNHDPLDASTIYESETFRSGCPDHVRVLTLSGVQELLEGIEVVAAPWTSKRPLTDLVADACVGLAPPARGVTRIVAGHGAVMSRDPDRANVASIDDAALQGLLEAGVVHAAFLGDRHSTTEVTERMWYPGAPEVTDRGEVDPGNVLVVDVNGAEVTVERVHVGRWAFTSHEAELSSPRDVEMLDAWLSRVEDKDRTAVWLRLSGTLTMPEMAALDEALERHRLVFAKLELWQRHHDLRVLPDDHDFDDLGLTGFAEDAVAELTAQAGGKADDAAVAQGALGLLYRLAGGGR